MKITCLTHREQECAKLLYLGFSSDEIANKMCISTIAVKNYMNKLYKQYNVFNRKDFLKVYTKINKTELVDLAPKKENFKFVRRIGRLIFNFYIFTVGKLFSFIFDNIFDLED